MPERRDDAKRIDWLEGQKREGRIEIQAGSLGSQWYITWRNQRGKELSRPTFRAAIDAAMDKEELDAKSR